MPGCLNASDIKAAFRNNASVCLDIQTPPRLPRSAKYSGAFQPHTNSTTTMLHCNSTSSKHCKCIHLRLLSCKTALHIYLPGASAVPANIEPHMTVDAPRARAFTMCPEFCTPPSATMGTPAALAARATWYTAVACPRPTAHTCNFAQFYHKRRKEWPQILHRRGDKFLSEHNTNSGLDAG